MCLWPLSRMRAIPCLPVCPPFALPARSSAHPPVQPPLSPALPSLSALKVLGLQCVVQRRGRGNTLHGERDCPSFCLKELYDTRTSNRARISRNRKDAHTPGSRTLQRGAKTGHLSLSFNSSTHVARACPEAMRPFQQPLPSPRLALALARHDEVCGAGHRP